MSNTKHAVTTTKSHDISAITKAYQDNMYTIQTTHMYTTHMYTTHITPAIQRNE